MAPKTTRTGQDYEATVGDALMRARIAFRHGERIGKLPWGADHVVDYGCYEIDTIISLKYQGVPGTADEKIPFEVIKLQSALDTTHYKRAYIVIAGDGMRDKLSAYYLAGGLKEYLSAPHVRLVTTDQLLGLVSRGDLGRGTAALPG